ncbi:MAG: hypothetical protein AAF990_28585 [Bacteroidota bacterium]
MKIDIAASVGELLYHKDLVVLAEFGAFVASYKPSVIDHVQGLLHPPAKQLTFDRAILEDDGIFVDFLCQKAGMERSEAVELIGQFVTQTLDALQRREIIVFPNVGRLYMDYEANFQFLQDSTNFNTHSFGLPTVQFYPILRTLNEASTQAPLPKEKWVELPKTPKRDWQVRRRLRALSGTAAIGLLLVFVAVGIYYLAVSQGSDLLGVQKVPVAEKRLNQKPSQKHEASIFDLQSNRPAGSDDQSTFEMTTDEDGEFEADIDTESITTAPGQKQAVIIIGAFGKKAGVRKRVQQIYELGFDAYQDKMNGLTRVGVQFAYEEDKELSSTLRLLKRKFDTRAYILEEE